MRLGTAVYATLAIATASTRQIIASDGHDFFTDESLWVPLSKAALRGNEKFAGVEQVFMRCSECNSLAASLALGEDTLTIPLPNYDGTISRFTLTRTTDAVIAEELQAQFPDAQTYCGHNDGGVSIEVDSTITGGVRVQYHGTHGELSYLDLVRSDDADLEVASDQVRDAVSEGSPVFRVYLRTAGQRASDPLAANELQCSTEARGVRSAAASQGWTRRLETSACGVPNFVNDGFCDPNNNNAECSWDGGDCCGRRVNKDYCTSADGGGPSSDACSCLDPSFSSEPDSNNCTISYMRDGLCDANNNNAVCGYDGSDCCGVFADKTECKDGDNCECAPESEFNSFPGQTYRIAIGTSQGYSVYHGNTEESVLSEVLTAVNRVGGIYKRSLNIGLQLYGNTTKLFEFSGSESPAHFDEAGKAIDNATAIFKEKLGSVDGFDVGHIVSAD
jgi:hypothetical protein